MMAPRSFLFVPGDSPRKQAKAAASEAHALMLDLEDSVADANLGDARRTVRAFLESQRDRTRQQEWVRINALDSGKALEDLAAIVAGAPDGVLLPKCSGGHEVTRLDHYLTALECREGVTPGSIRIMVVATETPASMFEMGTYRNSSARLCGLTWGAEDLATAIGASSNRDDDGAHALTYRFARSLCLLGAKAAGVAAYDTMLPNFRDSQGLADELRRARREGFDGKFAIHPDQVDAINTGFRPDDGEIAHARAIVAAFRAAAGAGAVQVNGVMVDRPHLTQALRLLEAADLQGTTADAETEP
jgi:citrate lyase subunit beta / citryl-CoA lyase